MGECTARWPACSSTTGSWRRRTSGATRTNCAAEEPRGGWSLKALAPNALPHPTLTTHAGSQDRGETKGAGRGTHPPPPSASTRSSPPKSSDTASSTSGLVESRRSSSSSRHDAAASQLPPASQLAPAAWCGQAHRASRSARPAQGVGARAEGKGGRTRSSWGSSGVFSDAGIGQNERAYGGGDASGRVPLAMQSKRIGWRQLTTGRRHRIGGGCRHRRAAAAQPPPAPPLHAISPQPAALQSRAAFEPRTGCQAHSGRGGKFMSSSPAAPRMPTAHRH